jgi:hypothetical protein
MSINPLLWTIKDLDSYEEDTNGCISFECDPIIGSQIWTKLACKAPLPPWCAGINLWEYAEVVRQFSKVMEWDFCPITSIEECDGGLTFTWKSTWTKNRWLEVHFEHTKDGPFECGVSFNTGTGKESRFLNKLFTDVFAE